MDVDHFYVVSMTEMYFPCLPIAGLEIRNALSICLLHSAHYRLHSLNYHLRHCTPRSRVSLTYVLFPAAEACVSSIDNQLGAHTWSHAPESIIASTLTRFLPSCGVTGHNN